MSESSGSNEGGRGPVRVELVLDDGVTKAGVGGMLKGALFVGLAGGGLFALGGSFLGRALVTWQETPPSLRECRGFVEDAVATALTSLLGWQLGFLGAGFALGFLAGFWKLRARAKARTG